MPEGIRRDSQAKSTRSPRRYPSRADQLGLRGSFRARRPRRVKPHDSHPVFERRPPRAAENFLHVEASVGSGLG